MDQSKIIGAVTHLATDFRVNSSLLCFSTFTFPYQLKFFSLTALCFVFLYYFLSIFFFFCLSQCSSCLPCSFLTPKFHPWAYPLLCQTFLLLVPNTHFLPALSMASFYCLHTDVPAGLSNDSHTPFRSCLHLLLQDSQVTT